MPFEATTHEGENHGSGAFRTFLSMKPFIFVVGKNKEKFYLRRDIIQQQSSLIYHEVLKREDVLGTIYWPKVDADTFLRFAQWAYKGDYEEAKSTTSLSADVIPHEPVPPTKKRKVNNQGSASSIKPSDALKSVPFSISEYLGRSTHTISIQRHPSKTTRPDGNDKRKSSITVSPPKSHTKLHAICLKFRSCCAYKLSLTAVDSSALQWSPRPNHDPSELYGRVLLCHAQLYIFAGEYCIEPLKGLSLHRLHKTLMVFTVYQERVADVVALAHFVYENTDRDDLAREVVCLYFCCIFEYLDEDKDFENLMRSVGDFAYDLMKAMSYRL